MSVMRRDAASRQVEENTMDRIRTASAMTLAAALLLAGCSTVRSPSPADPLEGFNRTIFAFNDKVDEVAFKPVAKAYNATLPQGVRNSVANFFSNISDVRVAVNKYLQGEIAAGTETVMRVAINSLFGVGGLFDVATQAKLPKYQADFGSTLGHYGVPPGPFLVLPLLGPSTVRDTVGLVADRFVDPRTYLDSTRLSVTLYGINAISMRAALLNATDLLSDAALDKYSFVRDAYLQRRQYLISGGEAVLPDYGDDDEESATAPKASAPASGAVTTPAVAGAGGQEGATRPGTAASEAPAGASSAHGGHRDEFRDSDGNLLPGSYMPRFW